MNRRHNKANTEHPDLSGATPGRIPESLIDAAIDGELDGDIQKEIARALNYDPQRKRELLDTASAINALQMPVPSPDLTDAILLRADRHRRFIPASWRRHVRGGRLGMAAGVLLTLMAVAGLQRAYPRLTTIAAHPTPVRDIEQAVEQDRRQLSRAVTREVRALRANLEPVTGLLAQPGRNDYRFEVGVSTASLSDPASSGPGDFAFAASVHPGLELLQTRRARAGVGDDSPPFGLITYASWTLVAPEPPLAPRAPIPPQPAEIDVPDLP